MPLFILFLLCACALLTTPGLAQTQTKGMKPITGGTAPKGTERRVAVIIANQDYQDSRLDLNKTYNDAGDMKTALERLGFDVAVFQKDVSRVALDRLLLNLGPKLRDYDVAFFYYSGHGAEYEGKNYLLPTDMPALEYRSDVATYGLSLDRVYKTLADAGIKTSIVVSDACRSLPMGKGTGLPTGMVLPTNNPSGTFTMFATRSGNLAQENPAGRNGYFTQELLKNMAQPNWTITKIFYETRKGVKAATQNQQDPSSANELDDDFVFVQTIGSVPAPVVTEVVKPARTEPAKPAPAPVADLPVGPAMVYVRGGTFSMGSTESDDEKPIHDVTVSNFLMGKYEVTVGEFEQFVDATRYQTDAETGDGSYVWTGSKFEKKGGVNWRCDAEGNPRSRSEYTHPVIHVSHNDALAYCDWLSKRSGKVYRLPTEGEWEYGAGGGRVHSQYSWGNGEPSGRSGGNVAGAGDGYKYTAPVGSFAPNSLGLYDMSGNVWEWCSDWYGETYYASSSAVNPTGPGSGSFRVIRGGGWDGSPQICRVAIRNYDTPSYRDCYVGFRVVSQSQ